MIKTKSLTWNDIKVGQAARVIRGDTPFSVGDIIYKTTEFYTREDKQNIQEGIVIYIGSPELSAPCNTAAKVLLNQLEYNLIDLDDVPTNYINFIGKKEYLDGRYYQLNLFYSQGYLSPFEYEDMLYVINGEADSLKIDIYYNSIIENKK